MKIYRVTLRHSSCETVTVQTGASDAMQAVRQVLDFEGAPASAILSIEERENA